MGMPLPSFSTVMLPSSREKWTPIRFSSASRRLWSRALTTASSKIFSQMGESSQLRFTRRSSGSSSQPSPGTGSRPPT